MNPSPVTVGEADPKLGAYIEAQLLQSLRAHLPQAENGSFVLSATTHNGTVVAGLVAGTSYGWLLTKCLWVADAHRRTGLGRRLMLSAENKARGLGCHGAWLDTSNPEAHDLYATLGYEDFGELANQSGQHPPTHRRWFMRKSLA